MPHASSFWAIERVSMVTSVESTQSPLPFFTKFDEEIVLDPSRIDAAFYAALKAHFTEAQIMELGAFIAFHYGMQMFMRSLAAAAPRPA